MTTRSRYGDKEIFDEKLGTILPSYSMYTSTLGLNATVPDDIPDQLLPPPPNYDANPGKCNQQSTSAFSPNTLSPSPTPATAGTASSSERELVAQNSNDLVPVQSVSGRRLIVTDDHTWRETILDNVHNMPNMTFEDHEIPKAVKMEIFYTKDIGEIGKQPEMIDPSLYEYKQGDLLNGYLMIHNTSNHPVPFEMLYLLFEGNYMVANHSDLRDTVPVKCKRFLEMFDFYGSWNDAHINRLKSEAECVHWGGEDDPIDPIDGSHLYFIGKKEILPNRTYKRFFSFRIPNNLLDTNCEHSLSRHLELPPTMGQSRWELAHFPERERGRVRDLSIPNTSVSYGVMARFIGRKSTWEEKFGKFETPKKKSNAKLVNSHGDEYIILKELINYVRVVTETEKPTTSEKLVKQVENELSLENMRQKLDALIKQGKRLMEAIESKNFNAAIIELNEHISQEEIEAAKVRQSYTSHVESLRDMKENGMNKTDYYEDSVALVKKSLTGSKKIGVLRAKTPKVEYHIKYIPPPSFREGAIDELAHSWKLEIPVDLEAIATSEKFTAPVIKGIGAELVVHTIKSPSRPIALEFNHNLIYNNNKYNNNKKNTENRTAGVDSNTFTSTIIKPFQRQAVEIASILEILGTDNFRVEKQLINDLKSVCRLEEKTMNLVVENLKSFNCKDVKMSASDSTKSQLFHASLRLALDLKRLSVKGYPVGMDKEKSYDKLNLVPSFQSCYLARFYHLSLKIVVSHGDCVRLKVPLYIDKNEIIE
ncbi:uncharacterized protein LODBEIA_P14080 [Lodderomyces beijingensis]|uniref:Bul1 N-terminal domain-containing protein n=1 Tax=Lodderomyces beijingensis TaxID=1775926 RepID=A0ABP0ZG93_9ASCO